MNKEVNINTTELLEAALYALNQIPRRHIFGGKYKDTYVLASEISNYLNILKENDTKQQ